MKRIIPFALLMIITLSSCIKEDDFESAVIRDFGDPAVDGCGWVVDISSIIYKPKNLPTEFEVDNLEVKMKYDILDSKANCGFAHDVYDEIHIKDIYKK